MEEEHTSGCKRLLNSLICALCVAPAVIIGSMVLLGWNERRAVCDEKAIIEGKDKVVEVGCSDKNAGGGNLVLFSCDLQTTGLTPPTYAGSDFTFSYVGAGLDVQREMYQCVESRSTRTVKDSIGGGTKTVTTYSYSLQWREAYIDSSAFQGKNLAGSTWSSVCGVENPQYPTGVPPGGKTYVDSMLAGPYTIGKTFVSSVPLTKPVQATSTPAGWTYDNVYYQKDSGAAKDIGDVRVKFLGQDWDKKAATVLGENTDGTIGTWTASDSWLCSGFTLSRFELGTKSKDDVFEDLESGAQTLTYILRIVGFAVMWAACASMAGPLSVAAECIPCIGSCLGDVIEVIAVVVTCPPACACTLGVIGVVWVAMRPMVGIPLMAVFVLVIGGYVGYKVYRMQQGKSADFEEGGGAEEEA